MSSVKNVVNMARMVSTAQTEGRPPAKPQGRPAAAEKQRAAQLPRHRDQPAARTQGRPPVENDVEVEVHHMAVLLVEQDVVHVAVPQPQQVPHLRPPETGRFANTEAAFVLKEPGRWCAGHLSWQAPNSGMVIL